MQALKNRVCRKIFHCIGYIFYHSGFEQLALALKNRVCLEIFHWIGYIFAFSIFEQLALALKNRFALEFFTALKYISLFRIFEEFAVALKTEFALKLFRPGRAANPPPRTPMVVRVRLLQRNAFLEILLCWHLQTIVNMFSGDSLSSS